MGLLGLSEEDSLALAAGFLNNRGGDWASGLGNGLLGLQRARSNKTQQEMAQLQLEQVRKQMAEQEQMRQLAQRFQQPGTPGQAPLTPNDDNGNPNPGVAPQAPRFDMGGYANALTGIDPMKGLALQSQLGQMNAKQQPKYHVVNGTLVAEPTQPGGLGSVAYEAPREQWVDAGRDPKTGQQIQKNTVTGQLKGVGSVPPSMNVNLPKLEGAEQADKGKLNIKNLGELQTSASGAQKENSILTALERNPVDTSKAAPITATAAAWLAPLGGERMKEIATNSQKFQAAATELVMNKQMLQKGPQTESDARRLEATVASLGNTKEANNAIIAFAKAQNNRTIAQHKFYNDYWSKKKTLEGADQAWMEGPGAKSLFDEPGLKNLPVAQGGWTVTEVK